MEKNVQGGNWSYVIVFFSYFSCGGLFVPDYSRFGFLLMVGLIVIKEIYQILQKKLDFAKFCKLQEAIWVTVINEIFKFPPHFEPFGYVNYLYELSLGYPNYPTQK